MTKSDGKKVKKDSAYFPVRFTLLNLYNFFLPLPFLLFLFPSSLPAFHTILSRNFERSDVKMSLKQGKIDEHAYWSQCVHYILKTFSYYKTLRHRKLLHSYEIRTTSLNTYARARTHTQRTYTRFHKYIYTYVCKVLKKRICTMLVFIKYFYNFVKIIKILLLQVLFFNNFIFQKWHKLTNN